jgi:hypothetical protein
MKTFIVRGEYGSQDGQYVQETMRAQTRANVIKNFKARVRKGHYGYIELYDHNIYAEEIRWMPLDA